MVFSTVPSPIEMTSDTIAKLNYEGKRNEIEPLNIVDECREALAKMPAGKKGVVVGSGQNSSLWKEKGWITLDIDPSSNPDIIADANNMTDKISEGSLDFLYAEALTFDPKSQNGVNRGRLLEQANRLLSQEGKLIILTSHGENTSPYKTVPDRRDYIKLLQNHGFHGIAELGEEYLVNNGKGMQQQVIYYGKKVRSGYEEINKI